MKWVEARSIRNNNSCTTTISLFEKIIMRFEEPLELVSDMGLHFLNNVIRAITTRHDIRHRKMTPYNPKENGLIECANGIIGKMLNKVVAMHKQDWDTKLASTVHAYNTTEKSSMGQTPFFLVCNTTTFQQVEEELPTWRIMTTQVTGVAEDINQRLEDIDVLEEERSIALEKTIDAQHQQKKIRC